MCSNQKGRQLSAFLLLAPLRNVELPENVVLPGNVEPPGNVEHRLDDADYSSLSAAYLSANPSPCPHSTTASPQPASPAPPLPDWNECSALPQPDDAHRGYSDPNNLASRRGRPAARDPTVRYVPPPNGHCRTSSFALCAPASNGIRSGHARGSA